MKSYRDQDYRENGETMKYLKILNFSCLLDLWIYVEWGKLECAPIEWEGYDSLPYNIMVKF